MIEYFEMAMFQRAYGRLNDGSWLPEDTLSKRTILEVPGFVTLGMLATLIAALVGTSIGMVAFGPISIVAIIFFPILIGAVLLAAVLAAPVTLGLFPMAAYLLRDRPVLAQLVIPAIGFTGGGAMVVVWFASGVLGYDTASMRETFVVIGMVSGLIAGAFYGRGLHP